ncbi:regulator of chromosome condensation 1/beta-lactamase-inhibitor protein II, partial [Baffinella frigidus]
MGSNLAYVNLGTNVPVVQLSTGDSHTCALFADNSVKCWGYGWGGVLGYGNSLNYGGSPNTTGVNLPTVDVGVDTVLRVWAFMRSTCVQMNSGDLKCWGSNEYGALGTDVMGNVGDDVGQMGVNLSTVKIPSGRYVISLSGSYAVCAVLDDASLICWGDSTRLALGYTHGNTHIGNSAGSMDTIVPVNTGRNGKVLQVSVSRYHTCILRQTREVVCWGQSSMGTFGEGNPYQYTVGIYATEMGDHLHVVDVGTTTNPVVTVSTGYFNVCVVLFNGSVKCWGYNTNGALGRGDDQFAVGCEPNKMGSYLRPVDLG